MRRQARISRGGAYVVRSASALQVWLWLLIFVFQNEFRISRSIQPGYLDFDNLPETNFTCAGKVIGGYYADLETSCQMFHVCTVGQQDEPMDIKFLCLNGTVFDQETRVCERVDEVDCTKSEKFYSLNLELYGSTQPPIIQPNQQKPQTQPSVPSTQQTKPSPEQEPDPALDEPSTTIHDKPQKVSVDIADSTEDPIQEIKKEELSTHKNPTNHPVQPVQVIDEEDEEVDEDNPEYEDDYTIPQTTTTTESPTTTSSTTVKPPPTTTIYSPPTTIIHPSIVSHSYSSPSPAPSPISVTSQAPSLNPGSLSTLDPSLLSPQEFIYQHRGPGSEAISFQRQSFRPADRVYITHAPPQQYDHFQYESARTGPRPAAPRPTAFVQRPQPFQQTTLDPRDQLVRPGPSSQPSERHETSIKHKPSYPSALPAQQSLPFDPYYYDRKRSDDGVPEPQSSLAARSVPPTTVTERPPTKPKSPPRVIVTASASVSDSNGKRLNYTVGNVVSAVKPIVAINYDDYKESDLIFDPFFLDVPKLQKRRKTRSSNKNRRVISVPVTTIASNDFVSQKTTITSPPPVTSTSYQTKSPPSPSTTLTTSTTTAAWNPNDYVDDNYEPQVYMPPAPLAVLVPHKYTKERPSVNDFVDKNRRDQKSRVGQLVESNPTSSAAQTASSQSAGAGVTPDAPALARRLRARAPH